MMKFWAKKIYTSVVPIMPTVGSACEEILADTRHNVSSERLFLVPGGTVTSRKVSVLPDHVEELPFLHDINYSYGTV